MMPRWLVLAFFGGIASNLCSFITRKALKDEDPIAFAWWFELIRALAFLLIAFFNFKLTLNLESIGWLFGLGIAEIASIYFFTKQQSNTDLSIASILMRLRIVWAPLFAFLILGERLNLTEYLGIGLILIGLITISFVKKIHKKQKLHFAVIFSIMGALMAILMKSASSFASTPMVLVFMSSPSILFFPLVMKNTKLRLIKSFNNRIKNNLTFVSFNIVAMYLYTEALRIGPASKVVGAYQSMMIVAVILGIVVLKEKENIVRKLIGATLTLGGVWLLI